MNDFSPRKIAQLACLLILSASLVAACQIRRPTADIPLTPSPIASFTVAATETGTASQTPTREPTSTATPPSDAPTSTVEPPSANDTADILVDFADIVGQSPATFGLNGWWTDEDAEMWKQRYAELNPQIVRIPLFHAVIEPENDNDDATSANWDGFHFDTPYPVGDNRHITYQRWFSALREADVTVMVFIPYLAPWLSKVDSPSSLTGPYPPNDIAEYEELIRVLLKFLTDEIGFPANKIIIEPVNEPDLNCGADSAVSCFWQDWQINELAAILESVSNTADEVDPRIRVAGPALCCRGDILKQLMAEYNAAAYLDIITFHSYEQGNSGLNMTFNRANQMQGFDKPVYLDEYGHRGYWSNGEKGALWHSVALGKFWKAGLPPIQFSMAEIPWMHEGYNELGLFYSWEQDWQPKPAYWVYVNFYNYLADRELVSISSPAEMPGVAAKASDGSLAIWVTNGAYEKDGEIILRVENWPFANVQVQVLDNLSGPVPAGTFSAAASEGGTLVFGYPIPPRDSLLFLLTAPEK